MSDQEAVENIDVDVEDIDVDVENYEEKPLLPANISLILSTYCANKNDNEPWVIKTDGSSSDDCDADIPTCSKLLQTDNPIAQGTERKILVPKKNLKTSNFITLTSDKELKKLQSKEQSGLLQTTTKRKYYASDMDVDSKCFQINSDNNCETDQIFINKKRSNVNVKSVESGEESILNINPDNSQGFSETSDTPDSISSTIPSCSTDLAGPSNSTGRLHVVSDLPGTDVDDNLVTNVLMNICNKSYLTDRSKPIATPIENVEHDFSTVPVEQCQFLEDLLENLKNSNREEDSDRGVDDSEEFVEDDDIVNPDIMYNIDLNEHYKLMDVLVEKIETTTDKDQTRSILNECMQLAPIPRVQHEPVTFTERERSNYLHGICEHEYEIDGDDWNKIMVKRAVIFMAHAGFSIASEESLYVLADVAVDYIRKLAITFKRNFDMQLNSSFPHLVDPVANVLQEIGLNGGIGELMTHYNNDIFGRRQELTRECERLQQIVDRYVERGGNAIAATNATDHQYVAERGPRDECTADGAVDETNALAVNVPKADGASGGFDLLRPFAGYVSDEQATWAADPARIDRIPRNEHVFDIRAYQVPYQMQTLNRLSTSASVAGRYDDDGPRAMVKAVASTSSNVRSTRDNRLASEFRNTLMTDLEDRFRRFTSFNNARDDTDHPSAESHEPGDETLE